MPELFDVHTPPNAWRTFSAAFRPTVRNERIAVTDALGRVLAADLVAPHNLPSFPRATVDGYAVAAQDTHGASDSLPAYLEVVGEVLMGQAAAVALDEAQCALVHTGGMIPADADAVVMVEHTQKVRGSEGQGIRRPDDQLTRRSGVPIYQSTTFPPFTIEVYRPVAVGQNVIQVGEDVRQGEAVLPAGHVIRPQDIGGLLALGIVAVDVAERPRVAILSQGDEVVPPEQEPGPGQVRDINSHTLAALARQAGAEAITYPIVPDRLEALQAAAAQALAQADLLVMSAGSSVSVRDMTAQVIDGLGRPGILVHGVSVKPGKPTILAVCDGKPVFGLPGNPVSAMVIFELFVTPAIRSLSGAEEARKMRVPARLARNIASATGREDIVQVRLEARPISSAPDAELWAVPVLGKSNLIYTLIRAEGVVRIPLDSNGIAQGEWVMVELR
jgi:molybdopterin molybdotransferase